jgi:hypothetical protein
MDSIHGSNIMRDEMKPKPITTANLPAFPKPQETNWEFKGLTKLEYFTLHIYASRGFTAEDAVEEARDLIKALDKDRERVKKEIERKR